jgi:hypothetical protein
MEFHCGEQNNLSSRICTNDGICVTVGDHDSCSCVNGYKHDYTGFYHFQNCSLEPNFHFLFFVSLTVVTFCGLGFSSLFFHRVKGKLRLFGQSLFLYCCLAWMQSLLCYLQDGFYEGCLIIFLFQLYVGFFHVTYLIPMIAVFLNLKRVQFIQRIWIFLSMLTCVAETISIGLAYQHVRDENPSWYNFYITLVLAISSFSIMIFGFSLCFMILKSLWFLSRSKNIPSNSLLRAKMKRSGYVLQLTSLFITFLVVSTCCLFAVLSLRLVIYRGSISRAYLMWTILNSIIILVVPAGFPFYRKPKQIPNQISNSEDFRSMEMVHLPSDNTHSTKKRTLGIVIKQASKKSKTNKWLTRISEEQSSVQSGTA